MGATVLKKMSIRSLKCDPTVAAQRHYAPNAIVDGPLTNPAEPESPTNPKTKVLSPQAGKRVELALIYGRATGTKMGDNRTTGDVWTALTGVFEGVCQQQGDGFPTGEVFTSGMVFLPGGFQEIVEGALAGRDQSLTGVNFAIRVFAQYDEKSATKYVYAIQNLQEPTATDELASLRNALQGHTQARLGPAPVQETAPAPVQETTPAPTTAQVPPTATAKGKGK